MPVETVRYTVTGANPQTGSIQVNVDGSGQASGSIVVHGVNAGIDTIQTFMDSHSLSSNQVQIGWQSNGGGTTVSLIDTVSAYFYNASDPPDYAGIFKLTDTSAPLWTQTFNSLMFNCYPLDILHGNPYTDSSVMQHSAPSFLNFPVTAGGLFSPTGSGPNGTIACAGNGYQAGDGSVTSFNMILTGSLVVSTAGTYAFTIYSDDGYLGGIGGGATKVSGPNINGGYSGSSTPMKGYPLLFMCNQTQNYLTSVAGGPTYINFPTPGIYPFEFDYAEGQTAETFSVLVGNSVILPVASLVMPASGPSPSGDLQLTPVLVGPVVMGTSQTLALSISGITYATKSYIGLLEGTAGDVYLANNGSTIAMPAINGNTLSQSAVLSLMSLSGSNGSYQSRLSLQSDDNGYKLAYNGSAFDPSIANTELTITLDDPAWYNPANSSVDAFQPNAQGGGQSLSVEVDYLVKATVASISPTVMAGNGSTQTLTINLTKPLHPFQNTTKCTVVLTGGISATITASPVLNSSGWVTAFTAAVPVPTVGSSTTASAAITLAADASLNYLNGTTFESDASVTYSTATDTINITAAAPPENVSFVITGLEGQVVTEFSSQITYNVTVQAASNSFQDIQLLYQASGSSRVVAGTATAQNAQQVGAAWQANFTYTLGTETLDNSSTYRFGYSETLTDGQNVTYWSPITFTSSNSPSSGHGGGSPVYYPPTQPSGSTPGRRPVF